MAITAFLALCAVMVYGSEESCAAKDGSCSNSQAAEGSAGFEELVGEGSQSLHLLQTKAMAIPHHGEESTDDRKLKQRVLEGAEVLGKDEETFEEVDTSQPAMSVQANGTESRSELSVRSSYYGPYTFNYPDGSSSVNNYCAASDKRTRLTLNSGGVTYNQFTFNGCFILACTFGACSNSYWYTSATPGGSDTSMCTCCGTGSYNNGYSNSPGHKSSAGNKIYRCSGSPIR